MANQGVVPRVRKVFERAALAYEDLQQTRSQCIGVFGTITNICGRLPALRDPASFASFSGDDEGLQREVYAQQLNVLEMEMGKLHAYIDAVQQMTGQLQRLAAEAQSIVRSAKLSDEALRRQLGADPSIKELVGGIIEMHQQCSKQVQLEASVLRDVGYHTDTAELSALLKFMQDSPEIDDFSIKLRIRHFRDATEIRA